MQDQKVSFHVLGAVRACSHEVDLKIDAPRQRALLAKLLVDSNRTVTTSELIEAIWGDEPPQHPESALHIVVSRLRRALDSLAPRLVRERLGYRMDVDPQELDLTRAHAYLSDAQRAMHDNDAARAAARFDDALRCWSGEPLSDVANFPFYGVAARQLQEFRVGLVEQRNVAYLRCGRELEVIDDSETWIRSDPWRERLRAQQMAALYRCGRQIDALAAYDDLRRLLVDDFGVDPGNEIQELHSRILRQDPSLFDECSKSEHGHALAGSIGRNSTHAQPGDDLVERLRHFALDSTDAMIVEGGPGLEKDWLVVEIPRRNSHDGPDVVELGDELPRMPLADSLGMVSALLVNDEPCSSRGDTPASTP